MIARFLGRQMGRANGMTASRAQIYKEIGQQSLLWAFVDVFRWIALLCFGCVAVVWLFKKVKPGKKAPAGAH